MKTLREYIDQLDEISRRDFLKGAGATAAGVAVGSAAGFYKGAEGQVEKNTAYDHGLLQGFITQGILTVGSYENAPESIQNIYDQLNDFNRRIYDKETEKNQWFDYAYGIGKSNFAKMFPQGIKTDADIKKFIAVSKTLLDRAKQSSYGYPQKVFKEEEVDEAASPNAVARILELSKNK